MHDDKRIDRRSFLASASVAGGAIALSAHAAPVYRHFLGEWMRVQANVRTWSDVEAALSVVMSEIAPWRPETVTAMGAWASDASEPEGFHLSFRGDRGRELVITNAAALPAGFALARKNGPAEFVPVDFSRQPNRTETAPIQPWITAARAALQTGRTQTIA